MHSTFGAFLAFLTLLGGSAIGHLVSQIWWRHFESKGEQYSGDFKQTIRKIITKYHLVDPERVEDENRKKEKIEYAIAAYGYMIHCEMGNEKMKDVVRYTTRRWDLYHLHSSVMCALWLGLLAGLFCRFCFFVLYSSSFVWTEIPIAIIMVIVAVATYLVLKSGREYVLKEYIKVTGAIIENSEVTARDLRRLFPQAFSSTCTD